MSMELLTVLRPAPDQTDVPTVPRQAQDLLNTELAQTCQCMRESNVSLLESMFLVCVGPCPKQLAGAR